MSFDIPTEEMCTCTHLVCQIEVWVHLDHLPAAITILIDSYEEARVILFTPLNIKVCCLRVAWNHIPIQIHRIQKWSMGCLIWTKC